MLYPAVYPAFTGGASAEIADPRPAARVRGVVFPRPSAFGKEAGHNRGRTSISQRRSITVSMVGKNIDDLCTRCGLTLAHIVLYEVKGTVRGVRCTTCGSEHRYRGAKPERQRATAPERRQPTGDPRSARVGPAGGYAALGAAQRRRCAGRGCPGLQTDRTLRESRRDRPPAIRPRVCRNDQRRQHGGSLSGGPEDAGHEPPAGGRTGRRMTAFLISPASVHWKAGRGIVLAQRSCLARARHLLAEADRIKHDPEGVVVTLKVAGRARRKQRTASLPGAAR